MDIPHLHMSEKNGFSGELEKHILEKQLEIENWFRHIWRQNPPLFTSSVDLRNAGFKIAAVDTNLFPAGYNNLNPDFFPLCIQATQHFLSLYYPDCQKILIIPENHTRNPHYYHSLSTLSLIIENAGYEVRIGSLLAEHANQRIDLSQGESLFLHPIERQKNKITSNDFVPCLILLNNDLSNEIPPILDGIEQPIEPPPTLGWSLRRKTQHFFHYQQVCEEFSQGIQIDPWLISPLFAKCDHIDFMQHTGFDSLADITAELLTQIQQKYNQYQIKQKPYVMIKADAGTYGMAVMPVHSPEELAHLNRKQRLNMAKRKGGQSVHQVIIQEGVPSFETVGPHQAVSEPVVYMIGENVIGGFYRVHQTRKHNENLNSPGMHFEKLAFATCCNNPSHRLSPHHAQNQFYVYSVIARLALLAAGRERIELHHQQGHAS